MLPSVGGRCFGHYPVVKTCDSLCSEGGSSAEVLTAECLGCWQGNCVGVPALGRCGAWGGVDASCLVCEGCGTALLLVVRLALSRNQA